MFNIPELRGRILFTFGILIVVRMGAHIPIPGINSEALMDAFRAMQSQNTLLGLFNMFAGGAFQKATLFALGIMPYITTSIIFQLMGSVVPYFQRLQKEGEEGRKEAADRTSAGIRQQERKARGRTASGKAKGKGQRKGFGR